MKKTDLHKIVREAIQEILSEADISPAEKTAKDAKIRAIDAEIKALQVKKGDLTSGREEVAEGELDEMANVAVGYQLAPDVNAEDFTGKKRQIILAMQSTDGPIGKPEVAKEMGYTMINKRGEVVGKQNPINADFMALVADGTIIPAGTQAAPRLNRPQPAIAEPEDGEDAPAGYEGPEGGIEGDMSDEEIEASFARMMGSGEEEPEAGEIETADVTTGRMSDEDYEAFMQYTDLENRLSKVKSDILKTKRSRPSIGDISDTSSNELQNLRDLKARLQTKMDNLLAGNEYLQSRQAKLNKKAAPEETETEPLDEWTKGRMQYYAGIKK
jgi:hypothetical protein